MSTTTTPADVLRGAMALGAAALFAVEVRPARFLGAHVVAETERVAADVRRAVDLTRDGLATKAAARSTWRWPSAPGACSPTCPSSSSVPAWSR